MCKAIKEMLEDERQEGREEGREETVRVLIETCQELGRTKREIESIVLQKLETTEEKAKTYVEKYWK